jgi:hypothetical protein
MGLNPIEVTIMNDKQKELLQQCRFYKGEEHCPYKLDENPLSEAWFWNYEREWFVMSALYPAVVATYEMNFHNEFGDTFSNGDGVPESLKYIIIHYFRKKLPMDAEMEQENYLKWYKKYYLKEE